MISISISPNTEKDDLWINFKLIFQCFRWKRGGEEQAFKKALKKYFKSYHVSLYNSGRSALYSLLKSLDLIKQDEVLLQAFTCTALVNPILWNNLKPVYVDIEDDFNINIRDLEKKITNKSKVLIVQHTFGKPCQIDKIKEIAKKHNLFLIEDCAHSLGAEYKGKKIGTFGHASFLSFSRDKVISCVYGGAIIVNNQKLIKKIKEPDYPSYFWVFQQLLHPLLTSFLIIPFYGFCGKYLFVFFQKINLLSKAITKKEKQGKKPKYFPKKMPNALACLAHHQFAKLDKFYEHRKKIAQIYKKELGINIFSQEKETYLRIPMVRKDAHNIIKKSWQRNLLLGDWYTSVIAPIDTNLEKMHYQKGSCPKAEKYTQKTLNLPTHINISEKKAQRIARFIKRSN